MSFFALVTGPLIADPQARQGSRARFATATLRVATEDEATLVSLIAFSEHASRLLQFARGDALAVSGRAKLTNWVGRDGAEKRGVSVVVEQIAAAEPARKPAADPRRRTPRLGSASSSPKRSARPVPDLPDDPVDNLVREPVPETAS